MQFQFTFKHLKKSDALAEQAQQKIEQKILRYVSKPTFVHVTFIYENRLVKTHVSLKGGDGFDIEVEAAIDDYQACLEVLVQKLEVQLKKHKEKLKHHKNHSSVKTLIPRVNQKAEDGWDAPIDAEDLIKYEKARKLRSAS